MSDPVRGPAVAIGLLLASSGSAVAFAAPPPEPSSPWFGRVGALAVFYDSSDEDERAAYVVDGAVQCDAERAGPGRMLVFAPGREASLVATARSRIVLLGGAPLDGPRHIRWNFVSSSRDRLQQAKRDWKAGLFPRVVGDEVEFTPLPE